MGSAQRLTAIGDRVSKKVALRSGDLRFVATIRGRVVGALITTAISRRLRPNAQLR